MQVAVVTTQSILVGVLSSYFTKTDPTSEDTRNAYLCATGMQQVRVLREYSIYIVYNYLLCQDAYYEELFRKCSKHHHVIVISCLGHSI